MESTLAGIELASVETLAAMRKKGLEGGFGGSVLLAIRGRTLADHFAQKVISILPFLQKAGTTFDDFATEAMGNAFDAVRQQLHEKGQPAIVYEIIATRIIEAAKRGERDPIRLQRAGLAALGLAKKDE